MVWVRVLDIQMVNNKSISNQCDCRVIGKNKKAMTNVVITLLGTRTRLEQECSLGPHCTDTDLYEFNDAALDFLCFWNTTI